METFQKIADIARWPLVLLLGIAYAFYAFWTQDLSEVQAHEEQIQAIQDQKKVTERKLAEANEFQAQVAKRKQELADLEQQLLSKKAELPKTFNIPELLNDIFKEAEQVGLELESVSPAASEQRYDLYASISVDIRSKGTFLQLFIFLDRLSKLKRLIGVTNVNLTGGGGGPGGERITLKGTTVGVSVGRKLSGGDRAFKVVRGQIQLMAYRII